jgi:hypothetical protein
MAMTNDLIVKMRSHDWYNTLRDGKELARKNIRSDKPVTMPRIAWELLREAAFVSRVSYAAPPRSGFPGRSAMPESVDEVTHWQLISAFLRGELDTMPEDNSKAPRPSSVQIDRADVILDLWHQVALVHVGDKKRLRRAVYEMALGVKSQRICSAHGLNYKRLSAAKVTASEDMAQMIEKYNKKQF